MRASKSKSQRSAPYPPLSAHINAHSQAINKRVPIIASNAGGIPLQVKHGINGWVVPTGDSSAVAQTLLDIYQQKTAVKRDLSTERELHGMTDPNAVAEKFVGSFEEPVQKVHADAGATSEDFWTVGNAARWTLLASRVLGLDVGEGLQGEEGELLKSMDIGKVLEGKEVDRENVWKMVMGSDMLDGEAEIR